MQIIFQELSPVMIETEAMKGSISVDSCNKPDLALLPLKGLPTNKELAPYVGMFTKAEINEFSSQQMKRKVSFWRDNWPSRMLMPLFFTMIFNLIFITIVQPTWIENYYINNLIFYFNKLFPGLYSGIFLEEDIEIAKIYLTLFIIEYPILLIITFVYIISDLTIITARSIVQKPYFFMLDKEYINEIKKEKKRFPSQTKIVLVGLIAVSMGFVVSYFEIFVQQTGRDRFDGFANINIYFFVVMTMLRDLGIALFFTIAFVLIFVSSTYEQFILQGEKNE
jgi:hypothetical protein